jgi:hypothetical protein
MIDGPICHQPRTLAEVRRPTPQNTVELVTNFFPWLRVAGFQLCVAKIPQPFEISNINSPALAFPSRRYGMLQG